MRVHFSHSTFADRIMLHRHIANVSLLSHFTGIITLMMSQKLVNAAFETIFKIVQIILRTP